MRVFTTEIKNGAVTLTVYKSRKSFESLQNWCDSKFINVATTKDLCGYEFVNEKSIIVYSEHEQISRMLLHNEFLKITK